MASDEDKRGSTQRDFMLLCPSRREGEANTASRAQNSNTQSFVWPTLCTEFLYMWRHRIFAYLATAASSKALKFLPKEGVILHSYRLLEAKMISNSAEAQSRSAWFSRHPHRHEGEHQRQCTILPTTQRKEVSTTMTTLPAKPLAA